MKEVAEGISNYFTTRPSDALYIALGGRLYYRRAPQKPVFPYAVFFMVSGVPSYYFTKSPELQYESYQFSIFTKKASASDGETFANNLRSLFDDAKITVSGWTLVQWERIADIYSPPIEEDGEVIHQENIQYSCIISR